MDSSVPFNTNHIPFTIKVCMIPGITSSLSTIVSTQIVKYAPSISLYYSCFSAAIHAVIMLSSTGALCMVQWEVGGMSLPGEKSVRDLWQICEMDCQAHVCILVWHLSYTLTSRTLSPVFLSFTATGDCLQNSDIGLGQMLWEVVGTLWEVGAFYWPPIWGYFTVTTLFTCFQCDLCCNKHVGEVLWGLCEDSVGSLWGV